MKIKRLLIKISGEVLGGSDGIGIDATALLRFCSEVKTLVRKKMEVAIVVGGGNFWRYRDNKKLQIDRNASDALGMMATVMNARLLQEAFRSLDVEAYALAAHGNFYFAEPYVPSRAEQLLKRRSVVICAGGTGNPYFTTDTAAALRALELNCNVLLKVTKVDGVYDRDPLKSKGARLYTRITYDEVLKKELAIMDLNAIVLCKENQVPVLVFRGHKGNILKAALGKRIGTLIHS